MTLDTLRYFVALTDHGSFTAAANACFVSQSALSRAILNLEKELGCELLNRESRREIQLTAAGQACLTEARRILSMVDALEYRVHRAAKSSVSTISVGYIAYGMLNAFRQACQQDLAKLSESSIVVETVYGSAPEIRERLISGELDCAILPDLCWKDLPGCTGSVFLTCPARVIVPRTHPLFHQEQIDLTELADSAFVFYDPADLPHIFMRQTYACQVCGFQPSIVAYGHKLGDIIDQCCQKTAVSISSSVFDYASSDEIHVIPLSSVSDSRYTLVRSNSPSTAVSRFFSLLFPMK